MKNEKPILFSTELVQAILDGRKTQTRRLVKTPNNFEWADSIHDCYDVFMSEEKCRASFLCAGDHGYCDYIESPYGKPGDELWVRETWKPVSYSEHGWIIKYKADDRTQEIERLYPLEKDDKEIHWAEKVTQEFQEHDKISWKPSIFLPRPASRIQLAVTDIRVERVQDITYGDVIREGISFYQQSVLAMVEFEKLWDKINADRGYSWESNPWVWVVDFEVKEVKS